MRTIIDIPHQELEVLTLICKQEKISRAEVIRRAIKKFVTDKMSAKRDDAFGLWKSQKIDALDYVDKLRNEWDEK